MFSPAQSLVRSVESGKLLPHVPALKSLYASGCQFRHGQVVMVAGRSGTQKSGFALWLCESWGVPTLYFSADMSAFTASSRLASMLTGDSQQTVDSRLASKDAGFYLERLEKSKIRFAFGSPIRIDDVLLELNAWVELWDELPAVIVLDNLMDFEGAEADYQEQMAVMQFVTELSRDTGSTVLVLHHASDKSWDAKSDPYSPPARSEIKNGLGEKPELVLGVAINPHDHSYRVAVLKQRQGPSDPTGRSSTLLRARPELTRFEAFADQSQAQYGGLSNG